MITTAMNMINNKYERAKKNRGRKKKISEKKDSNKELNVKRLNDQNASNLMHLIPLKSKIAVM